MPVRLLNDVDRLRLSSFPDELLEADLVAYYTLTLDDLALTRRRRGDPNRLGFALQLCTLRFLGFIPDDLTTPPASIVQYLSRQLAVSPIAVDEYADRDQTRSDHLAEAMQALGFRWPGLDDLAELGAWLLERALEHDRSMVLFQMAADHLRALKLVRPGVSVLERLVASARDQADSETYRRIAPALTDKLTASLDALLVPDTPLKRTPLTWLRTAATSTTPDAIRTELRKLDFVRGLGAHLWDLSILNPNRLKFLSRVARRSTNQQLQRCAPERRYPALVAMLSDSAERLTDEVIDLFDRALAGCHSSAENDLDKYKQATGKAANEKAVFFSLLARVILDDEHVPDTEIRKTAFARVPRDRMAAALLEAEKIARPLDDNYFDFLGNRYSHVREFAPHVVAALDLRANAAGTEVLRAVDLLRQLNADRKRRVPDDTPLDFMVDKKWRPYVVGEGGQISRRYWELCLLSVLRDALRAGDVWVAGSRRYANPETYLIPPDRWLGLRVESCALLGATMNGGDRLDACAAELERRLASLDRTVAAGANVRVEDGELVIAPLEAEELPDDVKKLQALVAERLPKVELADLLIEVDGWSGFSQHFTHAGGSPSRTPNLLTHLYAATLAQSCNFGLTTMADVSDLSYDQLAWTTEWYLRDETLKAATTALVNYQHHLPLAHAWGSGTLSSSDGQRFPVGVKTTTAAALPRYFGFGRGVTFYTWTSDQFSQFGSKVITSTVRDATYVLDGILDNETELDILEHTTDTAGYTDLVFALFDLLGLQFSPRIRDLGAQRLYRLGPVDAYPHFGPFIKGTINRSLILERWDDLLRVAASLKLGFVTSSLFVSRLQASKRQNALTKALEEYGRVVKTLFIVRFLGDEVFRRRINRQLNKGESVHALRGWLVFVEDGRIRRRQFEDQENQASCLNLVTNAIITWNTIYIAEVLRQLRDEGHHVDDDAIAHLSPAMYAHVNKHGKYRFDIDRLQAGQLRPLRRPTVGTP